MAEKLNMFMEGKSSITFIQGGITCEAIDEPRKSSKAIVKRAITLFALLAVSYGRDHNQQEHKSE